MVYVTGCDAPFLQPAFVLRMIDLAGHSQLCLPKLADRLHPLAAVYRVEVLALIEQLIKAGRFAMLDLVDFATTRVVGADELRDIDPDLRSLDNVNTPDDYERVVQSLQSGTRV